MKAISTFLAIMMVFMVGSTPMKAGDNEVVLNASQVSSAIDIETAINMATHEGTQPGIVTLDSAQGDFVYSGDDHTIDINVSNITLRSENGAVIRNCENGVFLDTSTASGITIEGITFYCQLSGVLAWGGHEDVTIRDNTFYVFANGIYIHEGRDWTITGNYVQATPTSPYPDITGIGVHLYNSSDIEIDRNQFFVGSGVILDQSTNSKVTRNQIHAVWHGIVLGPSASNNLIRANEILSTQDTGILFWGGNEKNKVLHNTVQCTWSYDCTVYYADLTYTPLSRTNKIVGNKLIIPEESNTFTTTLLPGFWSLFKLGAVSDGTVYAVDVTPLHGSVDGASISYKIQPVYDGQQWNDVLHVMLAEGAPKQDVLIQVYRPGGLRTILDLTEDFPPGEWRGYVFARPTDNPSNAYLVDLDPLEPSVEGATFARYLIHPEFPWGEWLDVFRVATATWLPADDLTLRARIYATDQLELASEINITLTPYDDWVGRIVGPSSLQRGYVVRPVLLGGDRLSDLDGYTIQAEFNGQQWNDVLRIHMGNPYADWESVEYNFQVYACDDVVCP